MEHIFNRDFKEFIKALNERKVEYILVGGYAVILYGYHRTTGDLDIWVNPTPENYSRLLQAFEEFGLPTQAISIEDFLKSDQFDVFTFGRAPVSIDIMTSVKGLNFTHSYDKAKDFETKEFKIKLIDYEDLIYAKKIASRFKDFDDIEHLEQE